MDAQFWHERWREGQIGFHQAEVNAALERLWPALGLAAGDPVLVPLCGKSLDMHWLRGHGHPVLGVELSEIAVRDFFSEARWAPTRERQGAFEASEAEGVRLLCGDFFSLSAADLAGVRGVYDRAALIALPPERRRAYARVLAERLPATVDGLLLTLEYEPSAMQGPPFPVAPEEVTALFGDAFEVVELERSDWRPAPPHLRARGLEVHRDAAWHWRRRATA